MKLWISILWNAMAKTDKGYRRHSLRHTGIDEDRRKDKLRDDGENMVPFNPRESKFSRAARLGKIGVRP